MTTIDMLREMTAADFAELELQHYTTDSRSHFFVELRLNKSDRCDYIAGDGETLDAAIKDAYDSWLDDREVNSK